MKTILIDGNNLIHKIDKLKTQSSKGSADMRQSLIEIVNSRVSGTDKVIFYFDGFGNFKKPNVHFSEKDTADNLIRKKIETFGDYKKLKVVSSDNEILNLAKVCGCEIQKSEDFWREINKPESPTDGKNINQNFDPYKTEKPDRSSKKEIDEYKKLFS